MLADHIESAKKVFKTICRELDKIECTYYKNENRLSITTDSRCDDLDMCMKYLVKEINDFPYLLDKYINKC